MYVASTSYDLLGNARFLTFLIAAAALWVSAWWVKTGWQALAFYLGGHYVMLWGLGLEALGSVGRNASTENMVSAESAAISVLVACYAVLLVGAGVAYNFALNRILGLGLIGLVIAKLYLYDVWLLVRIYRIVASSIAAASMAVASGVYGKRTMPSVFAT